MMIKLFLFSHDLMIDQRLAQGEEDYGKHTCYFLTFSLKLFK